MTELKRLVLRRFCAVPDTSCQPIIGTLNESCPNLDYLEVDSDLWYEAEGTEKPLKGFGDLVSLQTLWVDVETLVSGEERKTLQEFEGLLPPNLDPLHITRVNELELWCLLGPILKSGIAI